MKNLTMYERSRLQLKSSVVLFSILVSPLAPACIWDSDTIRNEVTSNATGYDLIVGQFSHHGDKYYHSRVKKLESKESLSVVERLDLSGAYMRLKDYKKSEAVLLDLKRELPNKYEVNSNLGVLYKKTGDFEKAYTFIQKALRIKPSGHMGLGDWYLKRIRYSKALKKGVAPEVNFLGEKYSTVEISHAKEMKLSPKRKQRAIYLKKMIHNDKDFADGYLVLGDFLWEAGDLNLALRAYIKASMLDHPNMKELNRRIDGVTKYLSRLQKGSAKEVRNREINKFKEELKKVEAWHAEFKEVEAAEVVKGNFPSLAESEAAMTVKRFYPKS